MESARALAEESGKGRGRRGLHHPRRASLKRPETSDTLTGSEEKTGERAGVSLRSDEAFAR